MTTTSIESIVAIFEEEYGVHLSKIPRKKIIYAGKTNSGKSIVAIMPTSRIYDRGHGWVDFTKRQIDLLKEYQVSVAIFRLSDGATYFIDMSKLFPMLTQENIMESKREGEHWKMDIWPDKIVIRRGKTLHVQPNEHRFICQLV